MKSHFHLYTLLAVKVSIMSPGWFATTRRERKVSIMIDGKEMAQNRQGINVVVFDYLSGRFILFYLISSIFISFSCCLIFFTFNFIVMLLKEGERTLSFEAFRRRQRLDDFHIFYEHLRKGHI